MVSVLSWLTTGATHKMMYFEKIGIQEKAVFVAATARGHSKRVEGSQVL